MDIYLIIPLFAQIIRWWKPEEGGFGDAPRLRLQDCDF